MTTDSDQNNLDTLDNVVTSELEVDNLMADYLLTTCKWAKFLSIVGFVMVGLMSIGGLTASLFLGNLSSTNSELSSMPFNAGFLGFIYVFIGLIYLAPTLYLYRFANKTRNALESMDQMELQDGFKNLKSLFKFMGMFTAIIIGIYALIFAFAIIGGGIASMF